MLCGLIGIFTHIKKACWFASFWFFLFGGFLNLVYPVTSGGFACLSVFAAGIFGVFSAMAAESVKRSLCGGDAMALTPRQRQERTRAAEEAQGIKAVRAKLGQREREMLDEICRVRGGITGAYSKSEAVAALIRLNYEQLQVELSTLGTCDYCGHAKPEGCGGKYKGAGGCYHTLERRALLLKS